MRRLVLSAMKLVMVVAPGGAGRSSLGFAGFVPAVIFLIFQ